MSDDPRKSHRRAWRAAAVVAVAALLAAGVWTRQRAASDADFEVVAAVAPQPSNDVASFFQPHEGVVASRSAQGTSQTEPEPGTGPTAAEPADDDADGPTFTYWDGDTQRTITLVAGDPDAGGAGGDPFGGFDGARGAEGGRQDRGGEDLLFRTESGSEVLLQDTIVLVLDPEWSDADVREFLFRNRILPSTVSPLGWLPNAFTITTGRGIPALELANALAGQDGVVLSSPNWAHELEVE